uniref:Zinc transporter ZIP9 n=1 Tax=Panagrolaimus sp. ES5 TaxID=591445 RepID=A0AC34GA82_9BILA
AGFVPLAFTFSESKVRLLSILGAGLLVGTALAVILPEGVEALQPKHSHVSPHNTHKDTHIAKQILEESNGENDAHPPRIVPKDAEMHADVPMDVNAHGDGGNSQPKREKRQAHAEFDKETGAQTHTEEEHHEHKEIGPTIGYSLIFGFILMLLGSIDSSSSTTGIMLLFSAGTFLYVATVHVLPELASRKPESHLPLPTSPSSSNLTHSHQNGADFTVKELIILIIGSLLPSLLASGHHH